MARMRAENEAEERGEPSAVVDVGANMNGDGASTHQIPTQKKSKNKDADEDEESDEEQSRYEYTLSSDYSSCQHVTARRA